MILTLYDTSYKQQLSVLLHDYFNEMEGGCVGNTDEAIDSMVDSNRHIYLLLKEDVVIGFTIMYINNQYGLSQPVAVNEYVYLRPENRTSMATKQLLLQAYYYCSMMNMDLCGTTYLSSKNIHNSELLGATVLAKVIKIDIDSINKKLNKLRKTK